jgi:hypothetical protein
VAAMALVAAAVPGRGRGNRGTTVCCEGGEAQGRGVRGRRGVAGLSGVGARAQEAKRGGAPHRRGLWLSRVRKERGPDTWEKLAGWAVVMLR